MKMTSAKKYKFKEPSTKREVVDDIVNMINIGCCISTNMMCFVCMHDSNACGSWKQGKDLWEYIKAEVIEKGKPFHGLTNVKKIQKYASAIEEKLKEIGVLKDGE